MRLHLEWPHNFSPNTSQRPYNTAGASTTSFRHSSLSFIGIPTLYFSDYISGVYVSLGLGLTRDTQTNPLQHPRPPDALEHHLCVRPDEDTERQLCGQVRRTADGQEARRQGRVRRASSERAHVRPVRVVGARGAAVGVSAGVQGVGVGVAERGCWEYHGGSYTDTGSGRPFCLGAGAERRPWFTRWPVTWPCYTFREI